MYPQKKVDGVKPMYLAIPFPGACSGEEVTVHPLIPAKWVGDEYNADYDSDNEGEDGEGCDEVYVFYDMNALCTELMNQRCIELIMDSKGCTVYRSEDVDEHDMAGTMITQ